MVILVRKVYKDQVWFETQEVTMGLTHVRQNQLRQGDENPRLTPARKTVEGYRLRTFGDAD